MSEIAAAYVSLLPSARGFGRALDREIGGQVTASGKKAGVSWGKVFGVGIAIGAGKKVFDVLGDSIGEAREAQKVSAITEKRIETMGNAAGISAAQVGDLSSAISAKVGIDDEAIQSGANLLLSFSKVRNEVGKGSDIFTRATKDAVDLSAGGFGSITGSSKTLGRALQDPIKGITALGRAGVTFTDDQKATIKSLVESNRVLDAQKIILGEVEKQVKGSAEAQATFGDKAKVLFGNLEEQVGTALIPILDDLEHWFVDAGPAISDAITDAGPALDRLVDFGVDVGKDVVPVLKDLGGVAADTAKFLDQLPSPVKQFGAELGIAALVFPKFIAGLDSVVGKGSSFVSSIRDAESRTKALGNAARNVAGIGGMAALAASTQQSDDKMKVLLGTLGGAATGFALGGPIGALIGGAGSGILGLWSASKKAASGADLMTENYKDLASTLDETTAATTKLTRARVFDDLEQNGVLEAMSVYGLSAKTVIDGVLGQAKAREKVAAAIAAERAEGEALLATAKDLLDRNNGTLVGKESERYNLLVKEGTQLVSNADMLAAEVGQQKKAVDLTKAKALATLDFGSLLEGLPKKAITEVGTTGLNGTMSQIVNLTKRYKLTPEQITTLIRAEKVDTTVKQVQKVVASLKGVNAVEPDLGHFKAGLAKQLGVAGDQAKGSAAKGGKSIVDVLERTLIKTKANLPRLGPSIKTAADGAETVARTGGNSIGGAMQSGIVAGFAGTSERLAAMARAAVRDAVSAAKKEGDIHSPSKKTDWIGQMLGRGLADGLEKKKPEVEKKSKELVQKVKDQLAGLKSDFDSIKGAVADTFTSGLFEFDNRGDFIRNLIGNRGQLKKITDAFSKLTNWGVKPEFLTSLISSGNGALVLDLAAGTKAEGLQASSLFAQNMTLANQLGGSVASITDDLGPRIDKLGDKLDELIKQAKKNPREVGRELNRPAANARRRAVAA